ncbi:type I restriction enzyme [Ureaplasma urealyticum serovar 2 str. ATCC 27814]|nr:type I restriction enzyme [Ureaplasma urealyticum serovar 2 str. ATCC 27814]
METIFKSIEESSIGYDSEKNLKGLFNDIDVNNNRLGSTTQERNKRLARILIRIKHKIFEFYFEKNC